MPAFFIQRKIEGAATTFPLTPKELEAAATAWQAMENAIFELKFEVASVYHRYTYTYPCFAAIGLKTDDSITKDLAAKIILETNCEDIPNKAIQQASYAAYIERYVESHIRQALVSAMLPWFSGTIPERAVEPIFKAETGGNPEIGTCLINLGELLHDEGYNPSAFCIQNPEKLAQRLLDKEAPIPLLAEICDIFLNNGKKVFDPDMTPNEPFYVLESYDIPKKQLFRHKHLDRAAGMATYYPNIASISMVLPDGDSILIWEKSETQKEKDALARKPVSPDPLAPKPLAPQTAEYMAECYTADELKKKEFHYTELSEAIDFAKAGITGLVLRISDGKVVYTHPGGYADDFVTG